MVLLFSASDVVSFDGDSRLTFRPGSGPRRTSKQVISMKFKTLRNSGTLLHAEGQEGLGLSLQLERGKLLLLLRPGTTHLTHRTNHNVNVTRRGANVKIIFHT